MILSFYAHIIQCFLPEISNTFSITRFERSKEDKFAMQEKCLQKKKSQTKPWKDSFTRYSGIRNYSSVDKKSFIFWIFYRNDDPKFTTQLKKIIFLFS